MIQKRSGLANLGSDHGSAMNAVEAYLTKNQVRFVDELCDYLRRPSISAGGEHAGDMIACAEWVARHCRKIGLTAQVCRTQGNPVVLARTPRRGGKRPHYLVYGHYDVQPPDPLELWKSPPFEPRITASSIFARGASDNKGQHFVHLKAVEAYLATGTPLPCDLTFVIEGEEEVGSASLSAFLASRRRDLHCDGVVISDGGMPGVDRPAIAYGLRGVCAMEVVVRGPSRDLHSGVFGGSVENPAMALCQMLARLRDKDGRIAVPGFYDRVQPLTRRERKLLAEEPFNEHAERRDLGVPEWFGERGYTTLERRTVRPTLEINGLTSGYQGKGGKTIVPAWARAKLTMRLVPDQRPAEMQRLLAAHLRKICPTTVRLEVLFEQAGAPYLIPLSNPKVHAAADALRAGFGREPLFIREGGSIPIVTEFKRILGADTLLLGLGLPDDNFHSPNEKFSLVVFRRGMRMSAWLWEKLAALT